MPINNHQVRFPELMNVCHLGGAQSRATALLYQEAPSDVVCLLDACFGHVTSGGDPMEDLRQAGGLS